MPLPIFLIFSHRILQPDHLVGHPLADLHDGLHRLSLLRLDNRSCHAGRLNYLERAKGIVRTILLEQGVILRNAAQPIRDL